MADRNEDRKYAWYVCGKCGHENYRLKNEEEDDCSECGAVHQASTGEVKSVLTNGDMETWTLATLPDSWTLSGGGASAAQESTIVKAGTYSAKLTRVTNDCYLYQSITPTLGLADWRERTINVGGWVYATVADRARIAVNDGVDTTYSDYHTGGSGWEYLTVAHKVNILATAFTIRLYVDTGDTSAYFDDICQKDASEGGPEIEIRKWEHRQLGVHDIPSKIRLDLNNPNG